MTHIDTMKQALAKISAAQICHEGAVQTLIAEADDLLCQAIEEAQKQETVSRTDQEIVDETEALAKWLMAWSFNHHPTTNALMRESKHPFAKSCWAAACHIQEMLTATDPENAVAELEDAPTDQAVTNASRLAVPARAVAKRPHPTTV